MINDDMLANGAAMKRFAPGTVAYMNEADRNDPDYIEISMGPIMIAICLLRRITIVITIATAQYMLVARYLLRGRMARCAWLKTRVVPNLWNIVSILFLYILYYENWNLCVNLKFRNLSSD